MAATWILSVFDNSGLTVNLDIYNISTDVKITGPVLMSEIGTTGVYKYYFTSYDPTVNYLFYSIDQTGTKSIGTADGSMDVKKSLFGKKTLQTIVDGSTYIETVYDDDGVTVLKAVDITTAGSTQTRTPQ